MRGFDIEEDASAICKGGDTVIRNIEKSYYAGPNKESLSNFKGSGIRDYPVMSRNCSNALEWTKNSPYIYIWSPPALYEAVIALLSDLALSTSHICGCSFVQQQNMFVGESQSPEQAFDSFDFDFDFDIELAGSDLWKEESIHGYRGL